MPGKTAAAVAFALAALAAAGTRAEEAPRNVLLLIADDLGPQLGCYGDPAARTPNLDRLAARGTRFSRAFATVSSCSPSRATMFTGLHVHASGQYGLAHAKHNVHSFANVRSLPRLLADAGRRAAIVGKVHVLPPEAYPFEVLPGDLAGGRDVSAVARAARTFFADCGDRPWALVVGFADAHRAAPGFANDRTWPGVADTAFDPKSLPLPPWLPDHPDARADLADYYRSVHRLDQGVGMVLDALAGTGNTERTLVVFISDNGPPFPGVKTNLYDAGIRLPLIVAAPGQKRAGGTCGAPVSWVDILPTALEWAGAPVPEGLHGRSLLPLVGEEDDAGRDAVFGSHVFHGIAMYYPMRMIRTRTHKYILNLAHEMEYPIASDLWASPTWQAVERDGLTALGRRSRTAFLRRPAEELYDLEKDPDEIANVAANPAHAKTLADLRERVRRWREKTKDPWLEAERYRPGK